MIEINDRTTAVSSFILCSLQLVKKDSEDKFFDTSSCSTKAEDVKLINEDQKSTLGLSDERYLLS